MPWLCPVAALIGFAFFFSLISPEMSKRRCFWLSASWFMAVQLIQLSWMTSIDYQGYYILFVYLFLCFALGLQFGLLAVFVLPMKAPLHVVVLAAFWTFMEWIRLHIACGFSWNPVGLALSFHPVPLQCASLFGVFGLTFYVMLTNLSALCLWRYSTRRLRDFCLWGALAAFPYLFGVLHLYYHSNKANLSDRMISAALVQTGLLPSEKVHQSTRPADYIPLEKQWESIAHYLQGMKDIDLIVLPEASVPFAKGNFNRAKSFADVYDCDVVIGLDHFDASTNRFFNSAFLLSKERDSIQRYDKRILLPLAEYLPFPWLASLTKSYGIYEFFSKGESVNDLKGRLNLSVSICYEETFPDVIRRQVKEGSDLLINLTNDGYYPYSLLPEQHLSHARLRTVENGRPLLRSCNTGVTCAVDSMGRIIARFGGKGDEFKRGALRCNLKFYKYRTLYSFWGDWGVMSISLGILVFFLIRRKILRKDNPKK